MTGKVLYPLAVLLAGALGAVLLVKTRPDVKVQPPQAPPPLVRALDVRQENVQLRVRAQGTVAARTESNLISQVAGQIVSISPAFASGGFFRAGEVLVTIDPRDYELALAQARAQVAQASVRLTREEEEAELARQEWERVGQGEPSALVLRKPQLAEARAALEAARAVEAQARINLRRTRIRAPFDGRVLSTNADVGQVVGPGAPIARIYAVDYAEIRLPVPHDQLAYLDLAFDFRDEIEPAAQPEVLLHADFAGRRHTWEARVVRVEGQIDPRTRMVTLVARVQNPYDRGKDPDRPPLVVGLFVNAEILGRHARDVAVLPRAALRGRDRVLVIDPENRLRFRTIDILRADEGRVVVRSGLADGERVCVSPLDAVVDGMRVRIAGDEEGPDRPEKKPLDSKLRILNNAGKGGAG